MVDSVHPQIFCGYSLCALIIFFAFQQLQAKKMDRIKAAEASLKVLLDQPTKETSELIKQAQTEYDGMYSIMYLTSPLYYLFSVCTRVHVLSTDI